MTDSKKDILWDLAATNPILDRRLRRIDPVGLPIRYDDDSDQKSPYYWEIGHIFPRAENGTDSLFNLQTESWFLNRDKENIRRQHEEHRRTINYAYLVPN